MESTIDNPWEDYKESLCDYIIDKKVDNISNIVDWIGGTHMDIKLAIKELLLSGKPIIEKDGILKLIETDTERKEEMAKRVKQLRELQEEINALKELKFEVKE